MDLFIYLLISITRRGVTVGAHIREYKAHRKQKHSITNISQRIWETFSTAEILHVILNFFQRTAATKSVPQCHMAPYSTPRWIVGNKTLENIFPEIQ